MSKRKWSLPGKITYGDCSLFVFAETRDEAVKQFKDGDFDVEEANWEASFDLDIEEDDEVDEYLQDLGEVNDTTNMSAQDELKTLQARVAELEATVSCLKSLTHMG